MTRLVTKVDQRSEGFSIVGEPHTIGEDYANLVVLDEIPLPDYAVTIEGFAEVTLAPAAGEFRRRSLDTLMPGALEFNAADSGTAVVVNYHGIGSYTFARDLNRIHDTLAKIGVPVSWFGAHGGGDDNTAAIQAALDAAAEVGGATVIFGDATYLVTDELVISDHRTNLRFAGKHRTRFLFRPTAGGKACFSFGTGVDAVLYQCSMRGGCTIYSDDTVLQKTALRVTDVSEFYCEDLAVGPIGQFTGNGSIGIQTRGREISQFIRYSLAADIPISIENNPNSTLDCDHFTFADGICFPSALNPNVQIEDGVYLSNLTIKDQAWVGGAHGFDYTEDTLSATVSHGVTLENIRWEQMVGTTGYMVRLNMVSGAVNGLRLINVYGGLTARGFYLRKCSNVLLESTQYVGTDVGIDCDTTCDHIRFVSTFWQVGGTISMTGLQQIIGFAKVNSGYPDGAESDAVWTADDSDRRRIRVFSGATGPSNNIFAHAVTLANGGTYTLPFVSGAVIAGIVHVVAKGATDEEGGSWYASTTAVKKIAGTTNTDDANTAGNLCVFLGGDGDDTVILNNLGEEVEVHIFTTWSSEN